MFIVTVVKCGLNQVVAELVKQSEVNYNYVLKCCISNCRFSHKSLKMEGAFMTQSLNLPNRNYVYKHPCRDVLSVESVSIEI
jgi:hypothetical protein